MATHTRTINERAAWKKGSFPARVCRAYIEMGGHNGPATLAAVGEFANEVRARHGGQCPARLVAEWAIERRRCM